MSRHLAQLLGVKLKILLACAERELNRTQLPPKYLLLACNLESSNSALVHTYLASGSVSADSNFAVHLIRSPGLVRFSRPHNYSRLCRFGRNLVLHSALSDLEWACSYFDAGHDPR